MFTKIKETIKRAISTVAMVGATVACSTQTAFAKTGLEKVSSGLTTLTDVLQNIAMAGGGLIVLIGTVMMAMGYSNNQSAPEMKRGLSVFIAGAMLVGIGGITKLFI